MSRLLVLVVSLAACTSTSSHSVPLSAIGLACDAAHPCPDGSECGTCGIATGQCVVACSQNGSGAAVDCPDGTFCSNLWSGTTMKACVRLCTYDIDCQQPTTNAGLSCNDPYTDNGNPPNDTSICNVDGSVAQTCS